MISQVTKDTIVKTIKHYKETRVYATDELNAALDWIEKQAPPLPPSRIPPAIARHLLALIRLEGVMNDDLSFDANLWLKVELEKQGEEY